MGANPNEPFIVQPAAPTAPKRPRSRRRMALLGCGGLLGALLFCTLLSAILSAGRGDRTPTAPAVASTPAGTVVAAAPAAPTTDMPTAQAAAAPPTAAAIAIAPTETTQPPTATSAPPTATPRPERPTPTEKPPTPTPTPRPTPTEKPPTPTPTPRPGIGQAVGVKNWDLAVRATERPGKELVWSQFGNKDLAAGTWFVVVVDMKNTGDRNFNVNAHDFELKTAAGATYSVSTILGAYTYSEYKGAQRLGGQVPPGVTVRYYIPFDIAPDATGLTLTFKQDKRPTFDLGE